MRYVYSVSSWVVMGDMVWAWERGLQQYVGKSDREWQSFYHAISDRVYKGVFFSDHGVKVAGDVLPPCFSENSKVFPSGMVLRGMDWQGERDSARGVGSTQGGLYMNHVVSHRWYTIYISLKLSTC